MKDLFLQNYKQKELILADLERTFINYTSENGGPSRYNNYIPGIMGSLSDSEIGIDRSYLMVFPLGLREEIREILFQFYHYNEPIKTRLFVPFSINERKIAKQVFEPLFAVPWSDPSYIPCGKSIFSPNEKNEIPASALFGNDNTFLPNLNYLYKNIDDYKTLGLKNTLYLFYRNLIIFENFELSEEAYKFLNQLLEHIFPFLLLLLNMNAAFLLMQREMTEDEISRRFRGSDFFRLIHYFRNSWSTHFFKIWNDEKEGGIKNILTQLERFQSDVESVTPVDFSGNLEKYHEATNRKRSIEKIVATIKRDNEWFTFSRFIQATKNLPYYVKRLGDSFYGSVISSVLVDRFMKIGYKIDFRLLSDGRIQIATFYKQVVERDILARVFDWVYEKQYGSSQYAPINRNISKQKIASVDQARFNLVVLKSYQRVIQFLEKELGVRIIGPNENLEQFVASFELKQKIRGKYLADAELTGISRKNKYILYHIYENLKESESRMAKESGSMKYFTPYYLTHILAEMCDQERALQTLSEIVGLINLSEAKSEEYAKLITLFTFNKERLQKDISQ